MIRSLYALPATICLAAAVVTAQAPAAERPAPAAERPAPAAEQQQPAAQQPARPAEASASAANKVTYTGCVKPGTGAETWILESAELAPKTGASAPSTVGTSGASKMTLSLSPAATVNLKSHANHKVEVVGTLSPAKGGADAAASATGARQQFSVDSLKMVAATCP